MIGRYTLIWVGLAAGVAAGLFQVKYEVQALEGKLDRVNRAILADQQAIHVLKAEWSLLNQPTELGKRASGNLALKPVAAAQIGGVADLPRRGEAPLLASAPVAVPPAQAATLKGPPVAAVARPVARTPFVAQLPESANLVTAGAKPRQ